jgi:hypothetical protein
MMRTQTLDSGLIIRQDFTAAVRPVFFRTGLEDFPYATHGGTLFLVSFRGRVYGLTGQHVFQDFTLEQMFITQEKQAQKGSQPAPIRARCGASSPIGAAAGTDVTDLCVIEFADDISSDFFKDSAYVIGERTVATSSPGHSLLVAGVLKEKSSTIPGDFVFGYCRLEFQDDGVSADPILRKGVAEYLELEFSKITGLSGAPVFDVSANALCGMVVRGSLAATRCHIYFVDIFDIMRLLEAVSEGKESAFYTKTLLRPVAVASVDESQRTDRNITPGQSAIR